MKITCLSVCLAGMMLLSGCSKKNNDQPEPAGGPYTLDKFCMGADLSYVNQIEDKGGVYRDSSQLQDPFTIFRKHGCNLVRVRLWYNPQWTRDVYGTSGKQMYSDLADAAETIRRAKEAGMGVCLDFHYSDTWADAGSQPVPAAWQNIGSLDVLSDSVFNYTYRVLAWLDSKGMMPEMVQIGNEINCGMLYTDAPQGFPSLNACNGMWVSLGSVINSAISAVREVSVSSAVKPKVILHVADPKNVNWWFDNIQSQGKVTDYDIIGISYYPLWHTGVAYENLQAVISLMVDRYKKQVMIVETAYPWTLESNDNYTNLFGSQAPLTGFPFTPEGQHAFMKSLAQKVISAGGSGIIVWEPGWITSGLVTQYGTGSAWENSTFFDFNGNALEAINFMTDTYQFPQP